MVVADPRLQSWITKRWTQQHTINEREFVLDTQSNFHSATPGVVIVTSEELRDKNQAWIVRMMKIKRICVIFHDRRSTRTQQDERNSIAEEGTKLEQASMAANRI